MSSLSEVFKNWLLGDIAIAQQATNDRLARIETLLIANQAQEQESMTAIETLQASVAKQTTVIQGAETLITELSGMIKAAGTDPAALAAITSQLDNNTTGLAAAVTANTPAAQPQP